MALLRGYTTLGIEVGQVHALGDFVLVPAPSSWAL